MVDSFKKRRVKSQIYQNVVIVLIALINVVTCREILPFLTSPSDGIYIMDIEMLFQIDMDQVLVSDVISNLQVI